MGRSIALKKLISYNLYLGYDIRFRHMSMLPYIVSDKCNVDILNLAITVFNLRLIISFVHNIYLNKGKIWLHFFMLNIKGVFEVSKIFKFFFRHVRHNKNFLSIDKQLSFLVSKWTSGYVSNYKKIKRHLKKKKKKVYEFPASVVFLTHVRENGRSVIPKINIADSLTDLKNV